MRVFLALNLPHDVRESAHAATEPLRAAAPWVAWTAADKLHLTVRFLGEQTRAAIDRLVEAIEPVVGRHTPVVLSVGRIDAFPQLRRPRVVWLGVLPDPGLELLHHDVETVCAAVGHPVEGRAFRPHVTLGRVRPGAPRTDASALASAARRVHFETTVAAGTLDVMLSEPGPGGSRYTPLVQLPLAGEISVP